MPHTKRWKIIQKKEIEDASAPIGVRKEYSWQIEDTDNGESCLIFYIVHSYVEVHFDDELIYSITADDNTPIGNSTCSNWVVIPLYQSDIGRKVTVTVTPVYKSVQNNEIDFKIGSRYSVFMQRLKTDLPQIVLSTLCIFMGILLIIVQLCFMKNKQTSSFGMLYLGIFALLLGIWRITDTRFSPIIFKNHTVALGYISLSALFIMTVPLLLFIDERHAGKFRFLLPSVALVNCAVAFAALVCQVAGIAELRETLVACHIMIILDIVSLVFFFLANARKEAKKTNTNMFVVLLIIGCITDLIYFYLNGTSSGVIFTTVAFLVYTFYLFSENILDINKKAHVDINTKLYNKTRWDEYINNIPDSEPIGVMMLDLNCLKYTNDTFGHNVGDELIVKFSEILRSTFDLGEFLCRWGGDEFAVIVRNANRKKMESYDYSVHKAVEEYNNSGAKPQINFACGYILSSEFPDVSRNELLTKADERMYIDKQRYYDKQDVL